MLKNQIYSYGTITKFFHWLLAVLVILQLSLGVYLNYVDNKILIGQLFMLHKSVGLILLVTLICFLFWNACNPKPLWPLSMSVWEKILARFTHFLLYVLLFFMVLTGWWTSTASGRPPVFFGWFAVPLLGVAKNKYMSDLMAQWHIIIAWTLSGVILMHAIGAFWHHFIKKDDILKRMIQE